MAVLLLNGAASGALHALSGPDHVLSLAPAALDAPARSRALGLRWGLGHALGTLLLALPLLLLARFVSLDTVAEFGDRLAGAALLLLAITSWRKLKSNTAHPTEHGSSSTRPVTVGLVHGASGAGSLLLLLPTIAAGDPLRSALFLLAFSVGSCVAMGALTDALGRAGKRVSARVLGTFQRAAIAGSALLGTLWLL